MFETVNVKIWTIGSYVRSKDRKEKLCLAHLSSESLDEFNIILLKLLRSPDVN